MKRIIASVAALGCTLSSVAQQPAEYEYVPMVREGVEWEFYWTENMTHNGIAKFYFNGEIEINGFTYKKCYRLETAAYGTESTLIGFMREENRVFVKEMLEKVPADIITMGNVDPAAQFRSGTVESIKADTKRIMSECCSHPNFVISSGCDIPPASKWENIDAFFEAVEEFYAAK